MPPTLNPTDLSSLRARLDEVGQGHVLTFWDQLSEPQRAALAEQIRSIDLGGLTRLIDEHVRAKPGAGTAGPAADIRPAPFFSRDGRGYDRAAMAAKGAELIRAGKVAAFTVAGGQGSRLGYDGPKGCFVAGAITGKPLFAFLAEWILAAQRRHCTGGVVIPWYIMTSPINHAATVDFFRKHAFFGLRERDVMFFQQGVMPSLEMGTGRMLLNQKGEIALNPDGHGGSLRALKASGALDDLESRGVEHLSYTQIDNPLVRVIDPLFIGLHAFGPGSSGQMSSKMVPKAHAGEKVGVFCTVNGRTSVIEYSDLPAELSAAKNPDGSLKFLAGSIAVHVIGVKFIRSLTSGAGAGGGALPWHRAEKKVPFVDLKTGQRVEPSSNNAVKLEAFVFDAIPLAESSIVLETDRIEEFAPIKNASAPGVSDSPDTCTAIQTHRAARWLEAAGCRIPYNAAGEPDCVIELSPLRACEAGDLKTGETPKAIPAGARVAM
jgi:UDP-N-acetylglucosamine/UDP-N-acetylgalactosamine diphosphorylase